MSPMQNLKWYVIFSITSSILFTLLSSSMGVSHIIRIVNNSFTVTVSVSTRKPS